MAGAQRSPGQGSDHASAVRAAGLRWTPQRQLILQTLRDAGGRHMTAEEVWRSVSEQYATLNRSTVYRVLETLTGIGLVRQTRLGGDTAQFELESADAHHHLVCVRCRQMVEISAEDVAPLARRLRERHGYHVGDSVLTVEGLCPECHGAPAPAPLPDPEA
ncbi:MAG TPA: transcriptional repressor [Candidatus Dormibacteraeota bacterium]|jgi:Fe2+ or Zn2+ uptake regulation protein|nr:transcriptional repressor [Candidatus Dormibacteraeota bacterium]